MNQTQTNDDPLVTALENALHNGLPVNPIQANPDVNPAVSKGFPHTTTPVGNLAGVKMGAAGTQAHPAQGTGPAVSATAVAQPKVKPKPRLGEPDFMLSEQIMNQWCATAPIGVTPEEAQANEFWIHVAHKMKPGDLVHVRAEDLSWYMPVMVLAARNGFGQVKALGVHQFDYTSPESGPEGDMVVQWITGKAHYAVRRVSTGMVVQDGFARRSEAMIWVAKFLEEQENKRR